MDHRAKRASVDAHLESLVEDSADILTKLGKLGYNKNSEVIEIVTTIPSAYNVDVFIGTVQRWKNIQRIYNRPLRIYGWSYNPVTEKSMLSLLNNCDNIFLTPIPGELRGVK